MQPESYMGTEEIERSIREYVGDEASVNISLRKIGKS